MKVYNAENMIMGRLAAEVAKQILLGEECRILNCEKAIISGRKAVVFAREKQRRERKGYPLRSLKLPRLPQIVVRKCIRGMLPWRTTRGREAYKLVHCFKGVPAEFQNQQLIVFKKA